MVKIEQNAQLLSPPPPSGNKTENTKGTLKAIWGGKLAGFGTMPAIMLIQQKGLGYFLKTLSKDEVQIINDQADNIINNITNLGKKGVKIDNCNIGINLTHLPDSIVELLNANYATAKGKNALFLKDNRIIINREKFSLAVFH